jgi:hypothetical protein
MISPALADPPAVVVDVPVLGPVVVPAEPASSPTSVHTMSLSAVVLVDGAAAVVWGAVA